MQKVWPPSLVVVTHVLLAFATPLDTIARVQNGEIGGGRKLPH